MNFGELELDSEEFEVSKLEKLGIEMLEIHKLEQLETECEVARSCILSLKLGKHLEVRIWT